MTSQHKNSERLAQFRHSLVGFLNAHSESFTSEQIYANLADKMKELEVDDKAAYYQLKQLIEVGMVEANKTSTPHQYRGTGSDPSIAGQTGYNWKKAVPSAQVAVNQPSPSPIAAQPKPKALTKADVKLDVVSETGRVRLTIKNLVIEIGVVDE